MSLPLCSTLINCYHTVNYKHCHEKKKKDQIDTWFRGTCLPKRIIYLSVNLILFIFLFGGYKRVHNILFRLSLILTSNMCSNMVSGYNFYCIVGQTVCVCVGVSKKDMKKESEFFILLGYFVFVSENEGKIDGPVR